MAAPKTMLLLAGAATLALGVHGPALAQSAGKSRCGWIDGVYACESTYETPYSKTYQLCASGGIDAACTTKTTDKEPPKPPKPYSPPPVQYQSGVAVVRGGN